MCINSTKMVADPGLKAIDKQRPLKMTRQEVSEKSDPNCLCLLIIGDFIYDCTKWQINHPGNHLTIRALNGKDATDSFYGTHPKWVRERMLNKFLYAELDQDEIASTDSTSSTSANDISIAVDKTKIKKTTTSSRPLGVRNDEATIAFRVLTKKLENAGLFETDLTFYYKMMSMYAGLLLLILGGVFLSDNPCIHALAGIMLGVFWQQVCISIVFRTQIQIRCSFVALFVWLLLVTDTRLYSK